MLDYKRASVKITLGGVLLTAAFLRFWYLIELQGNPLPYFVTQHSTFDEYRFMSLALEFVRGNWLGSHATFYSPGYSYLIAALFTFFPQTINTVFIFQILLGLMAVYILYRSACLLFEDRAVGLVSAAIAAVYAPFIFYECQVLRSCVITYSSLFGFYFLLRGWKKGRMKDLLCAGGMMGLSTVVQPNALPLFIVPGLVVGKSRRNQGRIRGVLLFLLGMAILVLPLMLRNLAVGGEFVISSQGLEVFWQGNAPDSSGVGLGGLETEKTLLEESQGSIAKAAKIFLEHIRLYPKQYLDLYSNKIKMFFNGYEIPQGLNFDLFREKTMALKIGLDFSLIGPFALLGLFLMAGRYDGSRWLYGFSAILSLSVILVHVLGRYRIPSVPYFILAAGYASVWLFYQWRAKRWRALFFAFCFLGFLGFWMRPDQKIIERYMGYRIRSIDYGNLASAYRSQAQGKPSPQREVLLQKASENYGMACHLSKANEVVAGYQFVRPIYWLRRAEVLAELGRSDEAFSCYAEAAKGFEEALKISPGNVRVLTNLGHALGGLGRVEEAKAMFEEALRIQPDDAEARYNLGMVLEMLRRKEQTQ